MSYRNVIVSWRIVMHNMQGWEVLEYCWIVDMLDLSYRIVIVTWRIVIVTWRIVMHTMRSWNILLDGRIRLPKLRSRDVLGYCWIVDMCSLSYRIAIVIWGIVMHTLFYRIVIVSWRIVMHTVCSWYILLDGRLSVHIMRSRDVLEYNWISDMHSLSYWNIIVSWRIIMHTNTNKLSERILLLYSRICVHIMRGRDIY
jgi:hypothetical protein